MLNDRKSPKERRERGEKERERQRRWETGNDAKCPDPLWLPLLKDPPAANWPNGLSLQRSKGSEECVLSTRFASGVG